MGGRKRPTHLDEDSVARLIAANARSPQPPADNGAPRWRDIMELSVWIAERAHQQKRVMLSPTTAAVVAGQLARCDAKPSRDQVAMMICRWGRCADPCYDCRGRANIVVNAYGRSLEREPVAKYRVETIDRGTVTSTVTVEATTPIKAAADVAGSPVTFRRDQDVWLKVTPLGAQEPYQFVAATP